MNFWIAIWLQISELQARSYFSLIMNVVINFNDLSCTNPFKKRKNLEPQNFSLVHNDSCEVVAWYLWVQNKMQFHYDQIIKSYVPLTDEQFCGCSGECKVLQVIILLEWIIFLFRRSNFRFKRCVSFKFWITNFVEKYVPYHLPILDPKIIKIWNYRFIEAKILS